MTFRRIFLLLPWKRCRHFIHIISTGYDFLCKLSSVEISNLREMSKLVLWEKIRKQFMNLSSAELAQRLIKVQLENESLTYCILLAIWVDSEDQNARKCRSWSKVFSNTIRSFLISFRRLGPINTRYWWVRVEGDQIYIQPDHLRSVIKIKDFRSAPNWTTSNLWIAIIVLSNILF